MKLLVIITIFVAFSLDAAFSRPKKRKEMCRFGDGSSYRGSADRSAIGHRCLKWNRVTKHWMAFPGIGNHNYCRNPDQSLMPWCYVQKGRRPVREYCSIARCPTPPAKPTTPSVKPTPSVDTELTCGERSVRRMNKIVGGSFTPVESQPWVAAIFHRRYGFLCGGSLISPCWVLTAAHCFSDGDATSIRHLSVYLGKTAINDTDAVREQSFSVEKLIIHQKYNDLNFDNDIALVKITKNGSCAVKSASVRTVCLPPLHTKLPVGFPCSIAGFGKESSGSFRYSQLLKQAEVKLISVSDCTSEIHYGSRITENMICARSPDWSTDACKGDSGGPLVCEASGLMFLFGVVSWGEGCAQKNKPGVYTQVTNYNTWIAAETGLSEYTKGLMYPQK
ncbi:plasminogen activator, urokinase a [Pholidichthys leucotaenia]